jgi:penicillin-binding protein 2
LFTAFAPAQDPKIALALVVENAGFGAKYSAPIARRVLDYWLLNQYPSEEDIAAVQEGKAPTPLGKPRKVSELPWPPGAAASAPSPPTPAASAKTAVR